MVQQYKYEELFRKDFNLRFKVEIKQSIDIALKAFNEFMIDNKKLMSYPNNAILIGGLKSFIVERQIYDRAFRPDAKYNVYLKETSKFHHQALYIETDHFIANIARTNKALMLPGKSAYRLRAAQNNSTSNQQMSLDFGNDGYQENIFPQYAAITYGLNNMSNKTTHLMYLVPDCKMSKILMHDDGLVIPSSVASPIYTPQEEEETIVRLKKILKKEVSE